MSTDVTADSPISWTQRHRLGQMVLERTTGIYRPHHAVEPVTVSGPLDLAALDRAWRRVQRRHPVVLCGFDLSHAPDFAWRLDDPAEPAELVTLPSPPDEAVATEVLKAVEAPFDLRTGPLTRLVVAPIATRLHVLALAVDHVIADFWSLDVLMHDLCGFYAEESGLAAPPRPPITSPFPDYARRQNAYLKSAAGIGALEAIGERLSATGAIPVTQIAGFTGAAVAGYDNNGVAKGRIDAELTAEIRAVARRTRMSMWTFIHAALHWSLAELSDEPVAATTMQTANRESTEVHQTIGWLAGKVVVPSSPGDAPDTPAFLRSFAASVMDSLDGSDVPWPRVIAEYAPEAFGRHCPLPYVGFNPQSLSMRRQLGGWSFPGCRIGPFDYAGSTPDPALLMSLIETDADIGVSIYHRADWYPADAAENLWQTVEHRLRAWVKESGVH